MRNLLNFLAKYHHVIVFLLLAGLALYLLFGADNYHNTRVVKQVRGVTTRIEKVVGDVRYYFRLREMNVNLAMENTRLRDSLSLFLTEQENYLRIIDDSATNRRYSYKFAEVINNSINKQNNFLTLDIGYDQGVEKDMAVISDKGAIGLVVGSSANYSVAMSLLNIDMRLSAKIRSNGYFGSLSWDGTDHRHVILSEIPQHVSLNIGDSIVTSGYSSIFPEGIMIGVISDYNMSGSDFYEIIVELSADFKKLRYVDVVGNETVEERIELEGIYQ